MRNPSSYLKMRVLGAVESAPGRTNEDRLKHVAELVFADEEGDERQFSWRTIMTWMYRYRNHGVTGIEATGRRDKGKPRKVTPEELQEAINEALPHFRSQTSNRMMIYRYCIEHGLLRKDRISQTTFYRYCREYELFSDKENRKRLAFSMEHANQLWQADTMYGPYVPDRKGVKKRTYLIGILDDASRVLCHGEFFFADDTDSLIQALRGAFYKRGIPEQLYVDNGANYKASEITLTCARIGTIRRHTPVRDGAAKGKIERFFRRVREQFLIRKLDLTSLESLNRQFTEWAEDEYNNTRHGGIGMKPIDRFGLDLKRIRYLTLCETTDELFYAETERSVKKDNTFSFYNIRYEAPVDCRGKKIVLRYERKNTRRVIVYYKDQRMGEAREVDLIANSRRGRKEAL